MKLHLFHTSKSGSAYVEKVRKPVVNPEGTAQVMPLRDEYYRFGNEKKSEYV